MQALGLLETKGFLATVEGLDVMLKTANVSYLDCSFVKGGIVCVTVTGDVAAVTSAVQAGRSAVESLGQGLLRSTHVIPRPDASLAGLYPRKNLAEDLREDPEDLVLAEEDLGQEEDKEDIAPSLTPQAIASYLEDHSLDAFMAHLREKRVSDLRSLARLYDSFPLSRTKIGKARKADLLQEFETFLRKNKK